VDRNAEKLKVGSLKVFAGELGRLLVEDEDEV
jgi:hypothetical protein